MTLGAGLLFSTILIVLALAAWRTTVNRKWKLIGRIAAILVGLVALLLGAWYAYLRHEDRPHDVNELSGVKLGMTPLEVTLALGTPEAKDEKEATGKEEKRVAYLYRHSYDKDYALVVIFYELAGQMRTSIICENNGMTSILGFSRYSPEQSILDKLGAPGQVSIKADGLSKMISYPKWHVAYELEKKMVTGVCVSTSGHVSFQDEYKQPTGTHTSDNR